MVPRFDGPDFGGSQLSNVEMGYLWRYVQGSREAELGRHYQLILCTL